MAVKIAYDKTENLSMSGGVYTVQRRRLIEGESTEEICQSGLLPKHGDRHPSLSRFRLSDFDCSEVGNGQGNIQVVWSGTYTSSAADFNDKEPWELDAHEFTSQPFSSTETINGYYTIVDGKTKKVNGYLKNTAGCALEVTHDVYGREYHFVFCVKAKGQREPNVNEQPILNDSTIKVAGITFEPYQGLLKPIQYKLVTDEDKDGNERSYYELEVVILKHPGGWMRKAENVGTMARFKLSNGSLSEPLPIYRYYKWTSKDKIQNLKTKPSLGSITDVYAARTNYANLMFPEQETSAEYWNAWQELPYEEVKEPLYLATDGTIDLAALKDASKGLQVEYLETSPASWKQYDLPSKREVL